ncbi:MAG: Stk1 family PASTA domain-containing Ser/Thr kinase [Oscillospiraceae bacterium]|jgi:serine/threonine protein kinase
MQDKYIGKKLDGRYEIHELIGTGGMAYVYKAVDLRDGKTVAVKILKDEYLTNEDLVRRFKNESKAIGMLNQKNIVKVYDVNFSDSVQYIAMEYVDGITLREYMDTKGKLSWKDTVLFTTQILKALQHAHDRGIIHRDIKPQNIMLLDDGTIKVMDFGIARFAHDGSRTITDKAIGSVHYISPEQARGDETGVTSDIYSTGVMMYEMLTGQLPFDSDSAVSVAIKQISDDPKPLREIDPSIPEGLEEITLKAMSKNPEDRYQSADQMLRDFEEFKKDPDIKFEYKYMTSGDPDRYFDKPGNNGTEDDNPAGSESGVDSMKDKEKTPSKETKQKSEKKGFRLSVPVMLLVTLIFVIASLILIYMILNQGSSSLFSNPEDTILPNFVGQTLESIQSNKDYKFTFQIEEGYNAQYESGVVYSQSPAPNKTVKDNSEVTLFVSKGTEMVTIPSDIVGMSNSEAVQTLQDLGLTVMLKTTENSEYSNNVVVSTDPAAGSTVSTGTSVTVTINTISATTSVPVPELIGKSYSEAKALLNSTGLVIGSVTAVNSDQAAGTVLTQSIAANTEVTPGTSISITISSGVQIKTVTFGLQMPFATAGQLVQNITVGEATNIEMPEGYVSVSQQTGESSDSSTTDEQAVDFTCTPAVTAAASLDTVQFTATGAGKATFSIMSNGIEIYSVTIDFEAGTYEAAASTDSLVVWIEPVSSSESTSESSSESTSSSSSSESTSSSSTESSSESTP